MRAKPEKKRGLSTIVVRQAPGKRSRAVVQAGPVTFEAAIGRSGRTAKAVRTLVAALADGRRVRVDVVDTDK